MAFVYSIDGTVDEQETLKMLNNSISTSNNDEEKKELYCQRLGLFFNMGKWEDVLKDIQYLETKYTIDDSIQVMKWKSTIYSSMLNVRNSMKQAVGLTLFDKMELATLYLSISQENVHDMINKSNKKNSKQK